MADTGGARDRRGRKTKGHPKNVLEQLRTKVWIEEVLSRAGNIENLNEAMNDVENIEKAYEVADLDENKSVFPTKLSIEAYLKGAVPNPRFVKSINVLFPGSSMIFSEDYDLWKAVKNPSLFFKKIERKYKCNVRVFSKGFNKFEFEELYLSVSAENTIFDYKISSKLKLWKEIFENLSENEIEIIYLPEIVCKQLPVMEYALKNSYYLPFKSENFIFEHSINDFNPLNLSHSKYDLLKDKINLYLCNKMLLDGEGYFDLLGIDIATRKKSCSLPDCAVSSLPIGIQKVYNDIFDTVDIFDRAQRT